MTYCMHGQSAEFTKTIGRTRVSDFDGDSKFPTDKTDSALSAASTISSAVPWLGGVVSNVISGYGQTRRFDRVQGVLDDLAARLKEFESDVAKDYVRTEDFEEILEHTLRRAADERNADIRKLYVDFIQKVIVEASDDYDAHMEVLNIINDLRANDIVVLRAMLIEPSEEELERQMGSPLQRLEERTGVDSATIREVIEKTDTLRITKLSSSLHTMMTGRGAASLAHALTPLGKRVFQYINDEMSADTPVMSEPEITNGNVLALMRVCTTHGGALRSGYALNTRGVMQALVQSPHFMNGSEIADAIDFAGELGYFEINDGVPIWTEKGCSYVKSLM